MHKNSIWLAPALLLVPLALTTGLGLWLRDALPSPALALLFLVPVLIPAAISGLRAGLAAAIAAFLCYNFCFIEPYYTLSVGDWRGGVVLAALLGVAGLTGWLAGRLRIEADAARRRADILQLLYETAGALNMDMEAAAVAATMARQLAHLTGAGLVLDAAVPSPTLLAAAPAGLVLTPADLDAVRRCLQGRRPVPAAEAGYGGAGYSFSPLLVGPNPIGVIGHRPLAGSDELLPALLPPLALALAKAQQADATAAERAIAEQERLRATLLASLSHDLRTPLATIHGAVTSLRQLGDRLDSASRDDLLLAVEEESGRLARRVANLLSLTRLEMGAALAGSLVDLPVVAAAAMAQARRLYPAQRFTLQSLPDLPPVRSEAMLLEQMIFNLLENAAKFSTAPAAIRLDITRAGDKLELAVTDDGPGIPPARCAQLFQQAQPGRAGDRGGSGIGLILVARIIRAMGGTIDAISPVADGHGTSIRTRMPFAEEDAIS